MTNLRDAFTTKKASAQGIAALTAYDYTMARLLDPCGLDFLLVGDSLGMIQLGMPDTVDVTMDHMVYHTRAAAAGARQTPLVSDLPNGSIPNPETTVANAHRLIEAGAVAVKLEGGSEVLGQARALTDNKIPFIGHLGMLPQRVRKEGGYKVKGRDAISADALLADALALQSVGAAAIVLELVAHDAASRICQSLTIPGIGIGSGTRCDGQILVTHDLVGFFPWFQPGFVHPEANLAKPFTEAVKRFQKSCR
jgi:3-methyl-2-oxobutanoate hydroxymethyltransferase